MGNEENDHRSDVLPKPVESQAGAGAYSNSDLDHFAGLSKFLTPGNRCFESPTVSGTGPLDEPVNDYNDEDTKAFARLMDDLGRMPRAKGVATPAHVSRSRGAYTDRDLEQFAQLLPPDRANEVDGHGAVKPAGQSDDAAEAVSYSASDIEAFRRIMPDAAEEPASDADRSDRSARPADANVGPIRIVDFGEQQTRSKRHERTEGVAIKIRYFD